MNYPEMSSAFPRLTEKHVRGSFLPNLSGKLKTERHIHSNPQVIFPYALANNSG